MMATPFGLTGWVDEENDPVAAEAAREAAAEAMRRGVRGNPRGGKSEGTTTKVFDAIGEGLYNSAARPYRIIDRYMNGYVPGQSVQDMPDVVDAVAGTAVDMFGMPAVLPGSIAPASVGIFGGRLAKTADLQKLAQAEEMAARGAGPSDIWDATGWFQGADKKWRFEIPDNASTFNADAMRPKEYRIAGNSVQSREGTAADVLKHPGFFEAYPDASGMVVGQTRYGGGNRGTYHPPGMIPEQVGLDANLLEGAISRSQAVDIGPRGVMLHELQHRTQQAEGFAKGGNPDALPSMRNPDRQTFHDALKNDAELKRYLELQESPQLKAEIAEQNKIWQADFQPRLDAIYKKPMADYDPGEADAVFNEFNRFKAGKYPLDEEIDRLFSSLRTRGIPTRDPPEVLTGSQVYERLAGEVEARNVQRRMNMTPDELNAKPPWLTEDIPADRQIVSSDFAGTVVGPSATSRVPFSMTPGLPMDDASRLKRARELDYNVDEKVFHETARPIDEFKPAYGSQTWFTTDPSTIGQNGAAQTGHVFEGYLKNMKLAGWPEYEKYGTDELIRMGYGGARLDKDIVTFDPKAVRDVKARFDPANEGTGYLLGSNAGDKRAGAALAGAAQADRTFGSMAPEFDWKIAREAEGALSPKAAQALESWVGGPIDAAATGYPGGVWHPGPLNRALADPEIGPEIEKAMQPVRDSLRAIHGDTVPLYRYSRGAPEGSKPYDILSFTADRRVAEGMSGAARKEKPVFGESEIAALEGQLEKNGSVKIGRHELKKNEDGYLDINGPDGYVTDVPSVREYIKMENDDALSFNKERAARLAQVKEHRIPVDDVVAATDRFNQREFIVRNRGGLFANKTDGKTGAAVVGADVAQDAAPMSLAPKPQMRKEDFQALIASRKAERESFVNEIEDSFNRTGRYVMPTRNEGQSWALTKNTIGGEDRPPYRITFFDGKEPTGHIEVRDFGEAAKEMMSWRKKPEAPAAVPGDQRPFGSLSGMALDDAGRVQMGAVTRDVVPFPSTPEINRLRNKMTAESSFTEADIPIRSLYSTQKTANADFAEAAGRRAAEKDGYELPAVYRVDGKNYLTDGHHRVAAAAAKGSTARVRFYDLDKARSGEVPDPRQMMLLSGGGDKRTGAAVVGADVARSGESVPGSLAPSGIRAYHGSPHDFDRFDLSKIGTGEGAQAYGHGLYFAENPKVAEGYKKDVSMMLQRNNPGWTPVQEEAATRFYANGQDHAAALKDITDRIADSRMYGDTPASLRQLTEAQDLLRGGWKPPGGKMYEVNINAKPDQFLDWDRPVARQGARMDERVSDALRRSGVDRENVNYLLNNKTGQDVVRRIARPSYPIRDAVGAPWRASGATSFDDALAMVGGDKGRVNTLLTPDAAYTAEALRQSDIPGIRYLDQGSRAPLGIDVARLEASIGTLRDDIARLEKTGGGNLPRLREKLAAEESALAASKSKRGTSNYVLFDDKIIDILRKYAIPGMIGGAGFGSIAPGDDQ